VPHAAEVEMVFPARLQAKHVVLAVAIDEEDQLTGLELTQI